MTSVQSVAGSFDEVRFPFDGTRAPLAGAGTKDCMPLYGSLPSDLTVPGAAYRTARDERAHGDWQV
jgi:hypothetical protein